VLVETQASLIYRTGKPFAIQGIARDITARKWTEEALWKSHARFDQLAEQSRTITWEVDTKGLYTFVSRVSEAIWGYLPAELVGRMHFYDLHPEEGRGEFKQAALAVFEQKKPFESLENATLAKDGRVVWVSTNGIPLLNAEGILQGYRGSDTDITVRKRAEEEKTKLQAQLHQAQKMECIGRLAGGVAHDFNNLLTVINGYSLLGIANLRPCDPLRTSLEEIHKAGERAAGLTRQLLAFSRKQVLQPRVLNLDCLLQEIRSMLERLVGEDVRVHLALGAESGTVRADLHQLEQVILNLVVNARDAMLDGGTLLIETAGVERDESHVRSHPEARAGRYIMLAVSDNGTGMDEATRRQIFEPFFTTKEVGKGTGLGLSMVQGIVAQSGGYVSVYSELGHGTTFTVYLPALAEAMADAAKPSIVPAMGEGQTVLVVEDQAEVREYAATVLKTYGYRVVKAGNAGEALILCEQERGRIHLVLTDVVMPHVSGRELANRLEQLQPGIRVLFMSGYTDEAILHHGVLEEGVAYIQKPFSPDQLAIKVREMLA
jgi:PAS domain S-box-containing protein